MTDGLDAFFAAGQAETPRPNPDFMARLQADALREMPVAPARVQPGVWGELWRGIGGWPALTGLSAAAVVGLWIGVSPPAVVTDLWAETVSLDYVDPASAFDFAMMEG